MGFDDDRRGHLLLVINNLLEVWQKWANNPDLKYVTVSFEEAVEGVILLFSEGTIPGDLRRLTQLVGEMEKQWSLWKARALSNPNRFQHPDTNFWATLENISQHLVDLKRPPPKRLEAVAKLRAMPGMTDHQICRIYGWYDANGNPELWKAEEEEADPGKHSYKLEGWLPPHETRAAAHRGGAGRGRGSGQRTAHWPRSRPHPAAGPRTDRRSAEAVGNERQADLPDEAHRPGRAGNLLPRASIAHAVLGCPLRQPAHRRVRRPTENAKDEAKAAPLKPAKPAAEEPPARPVPPLRPPIRPPGVGDCRGGESDDDEAQPAGKRAAWRSKSRSSPRRRHNAVAGEHDAGGPGGPLPQGRAQAATKSPTDMGATDPSMDLARVKKIIRQFTRHPNSIPLPADAVV